jgi:hypothetical protein
MIRRMLGLPPKHRHEWVYHRRTMSGWGIVHCATCGKEDLY